MKLKLSHMSAIVDTLQRIDPPAGKSNYKLPSKARFAIAKSMRKMQLELDTLEAVRQKLIDEHRLERVPQPDGSVRLVGEDFNAYSKSVQAAMDEVVDIELHHISEADLDLDNNQIPIALLAQLMDVLVRPAEQTK